MTDTELYQIVKDHREAWPGWLTYDRTHWKILIPRKNGTYKYMEDVWVEMPVCSIAMFEASFHRALMARGDVYTHHLMGTYTVQVGDNDFTGESLIEAYAKALEWLK